MADLIHVKGLAELQKMLDTLPVKIERNVLRGSLRAGMSVIKPVAQSNLHSMSGEISLKIGTRSRGGTVTANLKARSARNGIPNNLPIWIEYGTKAHFISVAEEEKPINLRRSARLMRVVRASMTTVNRAIRSLKISGHFVGPTVHHPGARPRPWMRPALDSQAQAAVIAAAEYMKKRLATKEGLNTADIVIEGDE